MSETPSSAPPRYLWPRYVAAAVLLFLVICVWWTFREVKKLRRIKEASRDMPAQEARPAPRQ